MARHPRQRVLVALFVATTAALSCQYPLVLVVSNATDEAASISLRLTTPDPASCLEPRSLSYIPASHIGRWFREPERRVAREAVFDSARCAIRGKVPPGTALELKFDSLAFSYFVAGDLGAELTLEGAAGSIALQGVQLRRHFEEQSGSFVLRYGSA